jgi:hypothetical protein
MGRILTNKEVAVIERRVDEINTRAEFLDPSNPSESRTLDQDHAELLELLQILECSYKRARIKESGLRLVS